MAAIDRGLQRRQTRTQQIDSTAGGVFKVAYALEFSGAGEGQATINFPVWFTEKPAISSGGELAPDEVLEDGNFPWCSAMVSSWNTVIREGSTYYRGATVVIVLSGSTIQHAFIHIQFEGEALQAPIPI